MKKEPLPPAEDFRRRDRGETFRLGLLEAEYEHGLFDLYESRDDCLLCRADSSVVNKDVGYAFVEFVLGNVRWRDNNLDSLVLDHFQYM